MSFVTLAGALAVDGKALSEMLALKPERGKPAFRNFREGDGNGGIIRSPLRAIALPDNSGVVEIFQSDIACLSYEEQSQHSSGSVDRVSKRQIVPAMSNVLTDQTC